MKPDVKKIRALMAEKGVTIWATAKAAGMLDYRPLFSNLLNSSNYVSPGVAKRIIEAFASSLGVPVDELLLPDEDAA